MKFSKIGQLNFKKFETEIFATEDVIKLLEKEKISLATLIPTAWAWYETELFDVIDENGDGKPDEKFGKKFKIIYFSKNESLKEFEKDIIIMEKTTIKNIQLKYVGLKD